MFDALFKKGSLSLSHVLEKLLRRRLGEDGVHTVKKATLFSPCFEVSMARAARLFFHEKIAAAFLKIHFKKITFCAWQS